MLDIIFDIWNREKKKIESKYGVGIKSYEGDVWWCSLGKNIGDEQDGKNDFFERPVLVVKIFNEKIVWIVPCTSHRKDGKYYGEIVVAKRKQTVILSQLRLVSTKRFRRKIGKIPKMTLTAVREKLRELL